MIAHIRHAGLEKRTRRGSLRSALLVTTALIGSILALPAQAQEVWEGGVSSDWFDAANWDSLTVPSAADDVIVAGAGTANFPVIDGAAAVANNVYLGFGAGAPIGTLVIQSHGTLDSNGFGLIGADAGTDYSVLVTGPGSQWNNTGDLRVGSEGTGNLTISNGGAVSNAEGRIGFAATGNGTVIVTGAGSQWDNTGSLRVGSEGTGSLTIADAGAVSNIAGLIGNIATGNGTVSVTGPGSLWANSGFLYVGNEGAGALTIADGGMVSNTFARIGNGGAGVGTVTVTGPGSLWDNSSYIRIGNFGIGSLSILNGGSVSSTIIYIGYQPTGSGAVTVDGASSTLSTVANVIIGHDGEGFLTLANDGVVDVASGSGSVFVALNAGSEGTVIIGGGDAAVGAGTLLADAIVFGDGAGSLDFNHTDSAYTFVPDISGNGTIFHTAGVTSYTGDGSGFTGITEIAGGAFNVNNILGGAVNVTGGTLGGVGQMDAVFINSGGTIAPGNSIGTLNFANININAGSTYEVEVNSAGQSDLINATGTATINGGVVQVVPFPDFALGTTYTIVTAAGGVTGTFDSSSFGAGSLFITPTLTYDANNVFLSLAQTTNFAAVAMTPNQIAAAGGAQSLGGGPLFTAIAMLGTADEANAAFDAISGEVHASAKTALIEDSRFPREATLNRLRVAFDGVGANTADHAQKRISDSFAFWGQGFGSWGHWSSDRNAAAMGRNIGGIFLGGDALAFDDVRLGLMGGNSRSSFSVSDRMSSGTVDSYTLGAYAGGQWDAFSLKGGVAHSWHSLDTARSVAFTGFSDSLSASYNARTFQAYTEAAYSIEYGNARFEPFANLSYVNLNTDGFTETGRAAALTSAGQSSNATFTTLGIRGETTVALGETMATLSGGLGWRHAFGNTPTATHSFAAGGSAFTVAGVPLGRDTLMVDAGFDVNISENAKLGISYSGQLGSGISDHGAKAGFQMRF